MSNPNQLLSVTKAAKLLGVHPLTLRSWAEKGHIAYFRTPGGHRRFKRADLLAFQQEMSHKVSEEPTLVTVARRAVKHAIAARQIAPQSWYTAMSEQQRDAMRSVGRNLLGLVIQYAGGHADDAVLDQGRELGRTYGQFARQKRMSISETVAMFNFFRDTIIDVTFESDSVDIQSTSPQLYRRLNHFMNEVLIATIQAAEGVIQIED